MATDDMPQNDRRRERDDKPGRLAAYAAVMSAIMMTGGALAGYVLAQVITMILDNVIGGLGSASIVQGMGTTIARLALSSAALAAILSAAATLVVTKSFDDDRRPIPEGILTVNTPRG